jgi:excisionase family DNA binding protein
MATMKGRRIMTDSVTTELARAGQLPRLIDINELARHLGVNVRHVRRLVAERRIPFVKWGHLLRFDPAEIKRWVDTARRPSSNR